MRHVGPSCPRLRWLGVSLLLCLCGAEPATQPAANPTPSPQDILENLRGQAAEKATEFDRWPSMGEQKMDDVLVLDYDGPALVPRTLLKATPRPRSLTIDGMPGTWLAQLRFNRAGRPINFHLERLDPSDPAAPYAYAELSAFPGKAMLAYQRDTVRTGCLIQLIDDRTSVDPAGPFPEGQCRLYVQVHDEASEDLIVDAQFAEADLPSLIARHRTVADVYLRPMLRALGQERLMLPDLRVVRQVLAVQVKVTVDPALSAQVRQLVGKLDSDDFVERRNATAALKKLGLPAAQALGQIDRTTLSAEQHNRVDEILDANRPITGLEAEKLGADKAFLIDCLELDDVDARTAALAKLQRTAGPVDVTLAAPLDVRRRQADALRAKWLPTMEKLSERGSSTTAPASKEPNSPLPGGNSIDH